jgi:hypothetical protein
MPSTQINSNGFVLGYTSDDLSQGDNRISVCYIQYPNENESGITILDSDVAAGDLGTLSFKTVLSAPNFILSEQNSGQNTNILSPIKNNLRLRIKTTPTGGGGQFDPCVLDRDGSGVISAEDVQNLYAGIPFVNPTLDIDGNGIVNEADYLLAREYIGEICQPDYFDPQSIYPVLDLDCLTYESGDTAWNDQSGNEYHFLKYAGGGGVNPIKNEDGSITCGYGAITGEDEADARRYFYRLNAIEYPPGTEFSNETLAAGTADAAAAIREKYIPGIDQTFSFEFVYKLTPFVSHGQDLGGIAGPVETGSQHRRFKIFGYPNYGVGGFNFGTGYGNPDQAFDPEVFIPCWGHKCYIYGGEGSGTQPGTWDGETGYPHPSEYPNLLPYSKLSNSRYRGDECGSNTSLNLDPMFGFPTSLDKFYVTVTFDPYAGVYKGSRFYLNGVLVQENDAIGIGIPPTNHNFVIGWNMQGGWVTPSGVDIYALRIYEEALTPEQVQQKYQELLNRYGT